MQFAEPSSFAINKEINAIEMGKKIIEHHIEKNPHI